MNLAQVIRDYIGLKQAMGSRFHAEAVILKAFSRSIGDLPITEVTAEHVHTYLAGHGPVTSFWHRKHSVLQGLYRFAIGRGYVTRSPLPTTTPKLQVAFTPYIYSPEELKQLLQAVDACEHPRAQLSATTVRTLLLLLYGAALRISEALALTLADVDIAANLLLIHTSKFYKTRWVPIGPRLSDTLATYAHARPQDLSLHRPEAPFFLTRTGESVTRQQAERVFRRVCGQAAVVRHDTPRSQPRLHDLRHTWAVHRLVAWYEEGADVQRLLPHLATYLGHRNIAATQCYLTMTPALLQAASLRFAQYAQLEGHYG
jgi:site-specific recombinase XerD